MTPPQDIGSIVFLWRYPVKSMMGEELNASEVTRGGLLGDRAFALIDGADGKVVSAKHPRKWPGMFDFRAAFAEPPQAGLNLPPARITLPDGTTVTSSQSGVDRILSKALKREVKLSAAGLPEGTAEEYWPDIQGLDHRDMVTDFSLPESTFFDCAFVDLITTSTLDCFRALYPQGRFEVRRFRPNLVVEAVRTAEDFTENDWVGKILAIGDSVRLSITEPCPRCVMTTLAQGDLPRDCGILRTVARHNKANAGVYAAVLQGGGIHRGDSVRLE
jgi:uncharacterized protein YcbX